MLAPLPLTRDLVLIGGGHTHALVARMWGMAPVQGVRVTIINPGPTAPYSGMLPGHIAGHYTREELDIDLVKLARFAGARLILGAATAIDPIAKTVTVAGHGAVEYDIASIDVGIHAQMPALKGFPEHGIPVKPLDTYAARWRGFLDQTAQGAAPPEVAVIGAGIAGVELALASAHALHAQGHVPRVALLEAAPEITANNRQTTARVLAALHAAGVEVITAARVAEITATRVLLTDGRTIPSRFTLGAAGSFAHGWLAGCGLPLTDDGFIRVRPDLRVEGFDTLFAVGDCAHLTHAPRPKAGVYAVRAAPILSDNLIALLTGGKTRAFHPQKDYLKLVSLGRKSALAEKWGMTFSGPRLWRWKNRIDQRFMEMFRTLPAMEPPAPKGPVAYAPEETSPFKPLCGGCGSKVGPGTLTSALAALPQGTRADVLSGPGDDAAILSIGGQQQVLTTDHLRAFTNDPALLARITAIHALGDIWAMGAAPQAALLSVTLPRMSQALQARTMAEILRETDTVLRATGAEIVGGHSTMGAEMTIGLTLTGLAPDAPITIAGAEAGDALVLTKPIGSGTILAAEMQGAADGRDVARLFQSMTRAQGDAATLLAPLAHAMTDVTGFGLAGHLMAICNASRLAATLDLEAIPTYAGALDLAAAGHRSTIYPANLAAAPVEGAAGPRGVLLHDPQTAGGLLAALPAGHADAIVDQLRAMGFNAARIGKLTAGAPAISCR
ncbi:selenide, water dikinase SelD [Thioclava sp. A2]|uniref:selenide, water dikinase SelD n=1 Tax=Thioclava sp. FCG-A2 TaxID=3080562 RepID=UPI002955C90F|nr:selenide, water dikinase SelD [Thioclava sp. A2]MDV7270056.1 selenide, water dikinase SelD [Thioclava sp. A2]